MLYYEVSTYLGHANKLWAATNNYNDALLYHDTFAKDSKFPVCIKIIDRENGVYRHHRISYKGKTYFFTRSGDRW